MGLFVSDQIKAADEQLRRLRALEERVRSDQRLDELWRLRRRDLAGRIDSENRPGSSPRTTTSERSQQYVTGIFFFFFFFSVALVVVGASPSSPGRNGLLNGIPALLSGDDDLIERCCP